MVRNVTLTKSTGETFMNRDGVSTAFELITDELERVAEEIANQGAVAFKERRSDEAKRLIETQENVNSFIEKVKNLLEEWQAGVDVDVRRKTRIGRSRHIRPHIKSKKKRLRVRFSNGKLIEENYAADTFALSIKEMGFGKVEPLGISQQGLPLVGTKRSTKRNQRYIDGKYVCVHSSTRSKKDILDKIANRLGVGLKVEMI
jgi:hypothetical protein